MNHPSIQPASQSVTVSQLVSHPIAQSTLGRSTMQHSYRTLVSSYVPACFTGPSGYLTLAHHYTRWQRQWSWKVKTFGYAWGCYRKFLFLWWWHNKLCDIVSRFGSWDYQYSAAYRWHKCQVLHVHALVYHSPSTVHVSYWQTKRFWQHTHHATTHVLRALHTSH